MPPKKIKFNVKKKAPAPAPAKKKKKGLSDAEFNKLVASTNKLIKEADAYTKQHDKDMAEIAVMRKKIRNFKR